MAGVEFSPILADHARSALGIDVKVSDVWCLSPFLGSRFDVVVSQSLEHVLDPRDTLAQCRDILAPNGLLMLEVPNQFHSLIDLLKLAVVRLAGEGAFRWFHRDITFEFHTLYFRLRPSARSSPPRGSRCWRSGPTFAPIRSTSERGGGDGYRVSSIPWAGC